MIFIDDNFLASYYLLCLGSSAFTNYNHDWKREYRQCRVVILMIAESHPTILSFYNNNQLPLKT